MAPKKRARKVDDDDEDEWTAQTAVEPGTQSHSQSAALASMGSDERDELISKMIRFLIFRNADKIPTKREDFTKYVIPKERSRLVASLLPEVEKRLPYYGFNLVKMEQSKRNRNSMTQTQMTQGGGGAKMYILTSTLDPVVMSEFEPEEISNTMGLILTISMLIMFNHNPLDEDSLFEYLGKLGIPQDDDDHPLYGNIRKLVAEKFVKQKYLERTKKESDNDDDARQSFFVYSLGPRIRKEVSADRFLEYVEKTYEKLDDESRRELKLRWDGTVEDGEAEAEAE